MPLQAQIALAPRFSLSHVSTRPVLVKRNGKLPGLWKCKSAMFGLDQADIESEAALAPERDRAARPMGNFTNLKRERRRWKLRSNVTY
jgi:hypothetical protein